MIAGSVGRSSAPAFALSQDPIVGAAGSRPSLLRPRVGAALSNIRICGDGHERLEPTQGRQAQCSLVGRLEEVCPRKPRSRHRS